MAHLDVDLPGAAFSADANDGASLPDAGSEFDELDRKPNPTGIIDEALRNPAPAPPPPLTPARLLPPPPCTTPRLLPPPARHTPTSTTPAPGGNDGSLSEADRVRRREEARKIESALFSAKRRVEQFAEEVRSLGNARSYAVALETVNLSRAEIGTSLTIASGARGLEREFPGFLPHALRDLSDLEDSFRAINKAATEVLEINRRHEREDQEKQRQAQQEREDQAARQREERAAAAATGYAPVSVARQQSDAAALYRKPDADLRPDKLECGVTLAAYDLWERRYASYESSSGLDKCGDEKRRVSYFIAALTPEREAQLFGLDGIGKHSTVPQMMRALRQSIDREDSLLMRRARFDNLSNDAGESVTLWAARINRGFLDADIANETHDQRKIARFVNGNRHTRYREMNRQIMQLDNPTFAEVVKFATTFEVADRTAKDLAQPAHTAVKSVTSGCVATAKTASTDNGSAEEEDQESVDPAGTEAAQGVKAVRQSQYRSSQRGKLEQAVSSRPKQSPRGTTPSGQRSRASSGDGDGPKCRNCGNSETHRTCPAAGLVCHECGKHNHFAKMCRSRRAKNPGARACKALVARMELELPEADARNAKAMRHCRDAPYIPPVVDNPPVTVLMTALDRFGRKRTRAVDLLPDSGSSVTMLPTHMVRKLGWVFKRLARPLCLATCGPNGIQPVHCYDGEITANDNIVRVTVYVAPRVPAVLSSAVCYALGILIRPDRSGNTGKGYSATGGGIATTGTSIAATSA